MIGDVILTVIGGLLIGHCLAVMVTVWHRRPLVVWSDTLARWTPARSRVRFELEETL